ncbi:dihydropteroate synthase [Staphylococcus xylosus]|uniref:Dihydropteroate synthase n=1 Tax=Staphylococcus xylosus TaxID=1288 RepID=A0A939SS35_STAXY|nr:dihydropteroate synthase [Staphylococcus xylosus]
MMIEGVDIMISVVYLRDRVMKVSVDEELSRVVPGRSFDSSRYSSIQLIHIEVVTEAAMKLDATMINDQWAGHHDPHIFEIVAKYEGEIVLMHNGDGHRDESVVDEMLLYL